MFLLVHHAPHGLFVVVGTFMAGRGALPETVVSLHIEEPLLIDPRKLELMIHVGGEHEIVPAAHDLKESPVQRHGAGFVAVVPYVAAPPCPVLLRRGEAVKTSGIHVGYAVGCGKVPEKSLEALPGIRESGRGGKPGSGSHEHGVGFVKRISKTRGVTGADVGIFARRNP